MKITNRMVALLLCAAILLGFYVPSATVQAATDGPLESHTWDFTQDAYSSDWKPGVAANWTWQTGSHLQGKVDVNGDVRGDNLYCVPSSNWSDFTAEVDVTVHRQGLNDAGEKLSFATFALEFAINGKNIIRFQIAGNTASLKYKTAETTTDIGEPVELTFVAGDPRNYTLKLSVFDGIATASVVYKTIFGANELVVGSVNINEYEGVKEGGLNLHIFRTIVPGASGTTAADNTYFAWVDVKSVKADVYSYIVINDENSGTDIYEDHFDYDADSDPKGWVEDSGENAFKVVDNAYKYTGTDYARTWLHVFETNVDYSAKIFVPKDTVSGQVGLLVRMSGLDVPGWIKVGYDYDVDKWFVEDGKGDTAIFGNPVRTEVKGTLEKDQWKTVRVRVEDCLLKVYYEDTLVADVVVNQITTGRVGLFSDGVQASFDDVSVQLLSGQGRVEQAVLANYVVCSGEGGAIYVYDENTLILNANGGGLYKSLNKGLTFTKIKTTDPAYTMYDHLSQSPRTQYIRLHDGNILKLSIGGYATGFDEEQSNDFSAYLYDQDGNPLRKSEMLYNLRVAGGEQLPKSGDGKNQAEPVYSNYYSGGMNEMLKEICLGDIDGDGELDYRVFHCADVRTTGFDNNKQIWDTKNSKWKENILYHWQEVYYSDDDGLTWEKSDFDTRWISGMEHVCESRVMPVYNEDGSLKCVRMFCTWNDGKSVRYFDSYDYGKTWGSEHALPELSGGRNSYAYAIDPDTDYIYLAYLYGEPDSGDSIQPRNRFVLLRSKDATEWEFLMDLWRWEDMPRDGYSDVNQTVDPSITIDGDYIYVTAGWSEKYIAKTPHNDQRQTLVVLNKNELKAYESFPDADTHVSAKDILYVEVKAPAKRFYQLGEKLDLTGGYLMVHYYDETRSIVPLAKLMTTGQAELAAFETAKADGKFPEVRNGITRADANHLWDTNFPDADLDVAGKQWIRVEYENFADGFFVYVAGEGYTLFDSATNGMTADDWNEETMVENTELGEGETKPDWMLSSDGKTLTAEFEAGSGKSSITNLMNTNDAQWSGYSVSADLTAYEQGTTGDYSCVALVLDANHQVRLSGIGTTKCTVTLWDPTKTGAARTLATGAANYNSLTANTDGGLTLNVVAKYAGGKLTILVEGVEALSYSTDCISGNVGLFVYRNNGFSGTVKGSLSNLKITAPTKRKSSNVALADKIALSFNMMLEQAYTQDPNAYMKFTWGDGNESIVPIGKANEDGSYTFTVLLAAKEMAETINADLYCWDGWVSRQTYSVQEYAEYIIGSEDEKYQEYKGIAQALLDYGAAAQFYFTERDMGIVLPDKELANGGFSEDWGKDIAANDLAMYKPYVVGKQIANVEFYGTSLIMESRVVIRHYLRMDEETAKNIRVTLDDGTKLALQYSDNFYYVDVDQDLHAANLDYTYGVTFTDGTTSFTVKYSALSYVYQTLSQPKYYTESLQRLVKALYLYNRSVTEEQLPLPGDDNEFEILPF